MLQLKRILKPGLAAEPGVYVLRDGSEFLNSYVGERVLAETEATVLPVVHATAMQALGGCLHLYVDGFEFLDVVEDRDGAVDARGRLCFCECGARRRLQDVRRAACLSLIRLR